MIERYEFLKATDHADLRSALHFIAGYAPEAFAAAMGHIEFLQRVVRDAREAAGIDPAEVKADGAGQGAASVTIPAATVQALIAGAESGGYRLAADPQCLGLSDGEIGYRFVVEREDGTFWAGGLYVNLLDGDGSDIDLSDWCPEDVECTRVTPMPAVKYVPAGGAA